MRFFVVLWFFFDFLLRWAGAALLVKWGWRFATGLELDRPIPFSSILVGGFLSILGLLATWWLLDSFRKQRAIPEPPTTSNNRGSTFAE